MDVSLTWNPLAVRHEYPSQSLRRSTDRIMSRKVTDLEKFALQEVLRPFWPTLQTELLASDQFRRTYHIPVGQERYPDRLEHTIREVADMLDVGPIGWRMDVFTRLHRMGIRFPDYIQHKLAVVVSVGMNMASASRDDPNPGLVDNQPTAQEAR